MNDLKKSELVQFMEQFGVTDLTKQLMMQHWHMSEAHYTEFVDFWATTAKVGEPAPPRTVDLLGVDKVASGSATPASVKAAAAAGNLPLQSAQKQQ